VSDLGCGVLQGSLKCQGRRIVSHESEPVFDGRFGAHQGTVSDEKMLDAQPAPKTGPTLAADLMWRIDAPPA
jgi:hypothetical protein